MSVRNAEVRSRSGFRILCLQEANCRQPASAGRKREAAEGFSILRESETCYRKLRAFPDIGVDDFLTGMKLEDYVALRGELHFFG